MATVRIGDRDIEVPIPTMGHNRKVLRPARAKFDEEIEAARMEAGGDVEKFHDAAHSAIARYLAHHLPSIDAAWLEDVMPAPLMSSIELIRAVRTAAGFQSAPPGEAKGP